MIGSAVCSLSLARPLSLALALPLNTGVLKNKARRQVKACDIAHVPLADGAVDVAVLSLALMGTNYPQFLREANRVVKANGRVLVAEVKSRCEHVLDAFVALLEGMGLRVDEVDKNNKMFIMFYLTKVRACGKLGALQPPELKACQYKKR